MDEYNFGFDVDLSKTPLLLRTLKESHETSRQPIKRVFDEKGHAQELCVAVHENTFATATPETCRYLSSAGTASCRGFFFRNPKTSASFVVHLGADSEEDSLPQILEWVSENTDELDMYIMGGESRCDFRNEAAYQKSLNNPELGTLEDIEETLEKIYEFATAHGIEINARVINLYNMKHTGNAVLDTTNGDFFFVFEHLVKPFILFPFKEDPSPRAFYESVSKPPSPLHNAFGDVTPQ